MLSKRLQSLTKYINKNDIVSNMIVSDIHENALNQGITNIKHYQLSDKIETRLGNGLNVLNDNDDINTILISGMGSNTILDIIDNKYFDRIEKLVIQSNNDHELLRKKISSLGYIIKEEEFLIDKNKEYINIVFIKGNKKYTNIELKYGPILLHNKEYIDSLVKTKKQIINYIPKNKMLLRFKMNQEIKKLNSYIK